MMTVICLIAVAFVIGFVCGGYVEHAANSSTRADVERLKVECVLLRKFARFAKGASDYPIAAAARDVLDRIGENLTIT